MEPVLAAVNRVALGRLPGRRRVFRLKRLRKSTARTTENLKIELKEAVGHSETIDLNPNTKERAEFFRTNFPFF